MISIDFKVFGLTQPSFEHADSGLESVIFRFFDLPEWEAGALLIQPPRLATTIGHVWLMPLEHSGMPQLL